MEGHWSNDFEHASITDENKEAFNTAMGKYETQGDALIGGFNAQKLAGKPFKMPESLDKLPDDASRSEFTAQVHKLFGITKAKDIKELVDVNLKDGLPEGSPYNEDFANSFKQFVIDNNLNVSDMPKYAKFFNTAMAKVTADQKAKTESDNISAAESCDKALIAHPDIGSKEKLVEMTELFVRAMKNNVGLTVEETKELADGLALSKLTTNPVLARVMLKQFASLAAEASSEDGEGGTTKTEKVPDPDEGSPSYVAAGLSTAEQGVEWQKRQAKIDEKTNAAISTP